MHRSPITSNVVWHNPGEEEFKLQSAPMPSRYLNHPIGASRESELQKEWMIGCDEVWPRCILGNGQDLEIVVPPKTPGYGESGKQSPSSDLRRSRCQFLAESGRSVRKDQDRSDPAPLQRP